MGPPPIANQDLLVGVGGLGVPEFGLWQVPNEYGYIIFISNNIDKKTYMRVNLIKVIFFGLNSPEVIDNITCSCAGAVWLKQGWEKIWSDPMVL